MNYSKFNWYLALIIVALLMVPILTGFKGCAFFGPSYDEGYEVGYERGYQEGFKEGRNEGESKGYREGYDQGFEEGHKEGYDESEQWWCNFYVNEIIDWMKRSKCNIPYDLNWYYEACLEGVR